MSDYSGNLDFSPTRKAKIAACEKLRDTVTGISALHKSLLDKSLASSPTHRNSFSEIYRMSTQAMAMKKEEMVIKKPESRAGRRMSEVTDNSHFLNFDHMFQLPFCFMLCTFAIFNNKNGCTSKSKYSLNAQRKASVVVLSIN
ncbi:hypothetical protein TNIN_422791 [Trichonephila inaurata madagascariensis]|uniref:Uncharacterized protein n=1 Tax=Trichonephila inaurata madagascariensis TaxID=2747483 RepID=A0A8X6WYC6_9ARAC|nr:hypothetical protein TNIN_422791 [Trichonephila inaurata madagascariensis]